MDLQQNSKDGIKCLKLSFFEKLQHLRHLYGYSNSMFMKLRDIYEVSTSHLFCLQVDVVDL